MIHAYISNLELANLKDGGHARITAQPAAEGVVCYSIIIADRHAVRDGVVPVEGDSSRAHTRAFAEEDDVMGIKRRDWTKPQPQKVPQ
jgi:hypothetical protein